MKLGDLGGLWQTLQKTQQELQKIQEELRHKCVEASAGGGKVTAVVNGRQELVKLHIDPEVVISDPDEIALLEDMVVGAVNQALQKSQAAMAEEMGKLAGESGLQNFMKMFQK